MSELYEKVNEIVRFNLNTVEYAEEKIFIEDEAKDSVSFLVKNITSNIDKMLTSQQRKFSFKRLTGVFSFSTLKDMDEINVFLPQIEELDTESEEFHTVFYFLVYKFFLDYIDERMVGKQQFKELSRKIAQLITNNLSYHPKDKVGFYGFLKHDKKAIQDDIKKFSVMLAGTLLHELIKVDEIRRDSLLLNFSILNEKFDFAELPAINDSIRISVVNKRPHEFNTVQFKILMYNRISIHFKEELARRVRNYVVNPSNHIILFKASKYTTFMACIMYCFYFLTPFSRFFTEKLTFDKDVVLYNGFREIQEAFNKFFKKGEQPEILRLVETLGDVCGDSIAVLEESNISAVEQCIINYFLTITGKKVQWADHLPFIVSIPRDSFLTEHFNKIEQNINASQLSKFKVLYFNDMNAIGRVKNEEFSGSLVKKVLHNDIPFILYSFYVLYNIRTKPAEAFYEVFIRGKWISSSHFYWRKFGVQLYEDYKETDEFFKAFGRLQDSIIVGYTFVQKDYYDSLEWHIQPDIEMQKLSFDSKASL